MIVGLILGVVLGYGLAVWREWWRRDESCAASCAIVREHLRTRIHQDMQLAQLFAATERLARQLVLQAACDKTRLDTER